MKSIAVVLFSAFFLVGCSTFHREDPLPLVEYVDLEQFMGKWFVIAATPTIMDATAHNAVERYTMVDSGVEITYSFNKDSLKGEQKTYKSTGKIKNPGINSDWNISFIWPFIADYQVIYLEEDYSVTVIGHPSKDYVWIMARKKSINDQQYSDIIFYLQSLGFDIGKIRMIPHN